MVPATLPYMFTGFRLSLGIAWLVIVAVEMLTGKVGIGQFIQDAYMNANKLNLKKEEDMIQLLQQLKTSSN